MKLLSFILGFLWWISLGALIFFILMPYVEGIICCSLCLILISVLLIYSNKHQTKKERFA